MKFKNIQVFGWKFNRYDYNNTIDGVETNYVYKLHNGEWTKIN